MVIHEEDRNEINTLDDFVGQLVWLKGKDGSRQGPFMVVKDADPGKVVQLVHMRFGDLTLPGANDVFYLDTQHRLVYTRN